MTNDARSKLRSMGGIMASSPELMQVAQKFNNGGPIMPMPPAAGRVPFMPRPIRGPMSLNRAFNDPGPTPLMEPPISGTAPVVPRESVAGRAASGSGGITMADWRKMSRAERKAAGFPVSEIGAQLFFDRFGVGMGLVDPDARYTSEGPVGVEELLERSSRLDTTDDARAERGFGRSAYRSGLDGPVVNLPRDISLVRPEEASKETLLKETQEARQALEESQLAPGVYRSSSEKRQAENLAETERRLQNQIASDPDIQTSREDTVMAQPLVPQELSQEQIDKAMGLVKESPDLSFLNPEGEDTTPAPDGDTTPDPNITPPPPGGGDDKPTKRDLRSRYNDQLALMQEIYGLEDKDEAQERAMSLAMIGLAIAAGQSPNALTNIAQGAMVGLNAMGERRDAARERERGLKTLALQTAIDQQAAEAGAEAEAAKMDLEQRNQLELEEYKARVGAMYGGAGGSRDARNIIDFTQNTYTEALKAASAMTAPDFDPDTETPHQYAMRQAQQASESMGRMFPGYGGLTSPDVPPAPEIPTITTREEYDALPSGAKFMQNGQERIKP